MPTNQNIFPVIQSVKCVVFSQKKRKRLFSEGGFWNSVTQPNTSKNVVLSKIKEKLGGLPANQKKTFFRCNIPGKHTTLRKTDHNIFFLCCTAECNVFQLRKSKTADFCDIKLKEAQFRCQLTKRYFRCYKAQSSVLEKKLEKKSIYRCNNAGKAQFDGNQSKNMFLVQ